MSLIDPKRAGDPLGCNERHNFSIQNMTSEISLGQ
jgi:hypothetical protein